LNEKGDNTELKDGALTIVTNCIESAVFFISPLGHLMSSMNDRSWENRL